MTEEQITEQDVEETPETEAPDMDVEETPEEEPETFPREYVEKLRKEAAEHRVKAKRAEQYAQELHAARVASTGRLADPSDLPFAEEHLEDMSKLEAAIDALLQSKPHLGSRRPIGDIGQGSLSAGDANVNLAGILRQRA